MENAMRLFDTAARGRLRRLRLASLLEGTTLLVLLGVAVPLKHLGGWDGAVKLMGPVHGLAFVGYAWATLQLVAETNARWTDAARLIALALVPFGGFIGARRVACRMQALDAGDGA